MPDTAFIPALTYLQQLQAQLFFWAIVAWLWIVGGAIFSWFYINQRGKNLGLPWLTIHHWRMAGIILGPLAAFLFYLWSANKKPRA